MPQHAAVLEDPPSGDGVGLLEHGLLEQDDDPDSYKKRHTQLHRIAGNQTFKAMQAATESSQRANPRGNRFVPKSPDARDERKSRWADTQQRQSLLLPILGAMKPRGSVEPPRRLSSGARLRPSIRMTTKSSKANGTGQHTVEWDKPFSCELGGKQVTLRPGSCDLSLYPRVFSADPKQPPRALEGEDLGALERLIIELASVPGDTLFTQPDRNGAFPIHTLAVANSDASVELVLRLFEAKPEWMIQPHKEGPYEGENCMHIFATNQRESALCRMIDIAGGGGLISSQLEKLLWSEARGTFYDKPPMCLYGSSPVAYLVGFGLRDTLGHLLVFAHRRKGSIPWWAALVDVNDAKRACSHTGFLPLHVATALDLPDMYNFLADLADLPTVDYLRADPRLRSGTDAARPPPSLAEQYGGLTPLQLAAKMANYRMFRHIMARRSIVLWRWGPATAYQVSLAEIDSGNPEGNDVMELTASISATKHTREMLLNTFMGGFLHELFLLKWEVFARRWYIYHLLADSLYTLLLNLTIFLSIYCHDCGVHDRNSHGLAVTLLVVMGLTSAEDVRSSYLCWVNYQGTAGNRVNIRTRSWKLIRWMNYHGFLLGFISYSFAIVSCATILTCWPPSFVDDAPANSNSTNSAFGALAASPRRMAPPTCGFSNFEDALNVVRTAGAAAVATGVFQMIDTVLAPFQRLGIFWLSVLQIMLNDLSVFLLIFLLIFCTSGTVLLIIYPTGQPLAPQFDEVGTALEGMIQLAFTGEPLTLNMSSATWDLVHDQGTRLNLMLFLLLYAVYVLSAVILMLNLLVAMLNNTYNVVQSKAELEWRYGFARRVILLELQCRGPPFNRTNTFVGRKEGDEYYFEFRGGSVRGKAREGAAASDGADEMGRHMIQDSSDEDVDVLSSRFANMLRRAEGRLDLTDGKLTLSPAQQCDAAARSSDAFPAEGRITEEATDEGSSARAADEPDGGGGDGGGGSNGGNGGGVETARRASVEAAEGAGAPVQRINRTASV